jgi:hypothetical protein
MKTHTITFILIILTVASCDNSRTPEKSNPETPRALEDKNSSYEIVSKRGSDDLVEDLYNELADKTPELKELENQIENLNKSKSDSTYLFNKYNRKNQSYYNTADSHIDQMKDTALRDKLKLLISSSQTKYNSTISRHSDLLNLIEAKTSTLNDLHEILKVTRTLPLIEKYQNDNLPKTKSLQGYLNHLDQTLEFADTLTKK